jgi:hypothetical protein
MDMEHIKPSTMLTFCAILYSPIHFFMFFIERYIFMLAIVTHIHMTGKVTNERKNIIAMKYNYRNYTAIYGRSLMWVQ